MTYHPFMLRAVARHLALVWCLILIACTPPPPPVVVAAAPAAPTASIAVGNEGAPEPSEPLADDPDPGPIPVTAADPTWGRHDAPVTLVVFADFQCPFCTRLMSTIEAMENHYGPGTLRVVWKNNPLPFHMDARPAAEIAMSMYERFGNDGFWKVHQAFFTEQRRLKEVSADLAAQAGFTESELHRGRAKVHADIDLAKRSGVTGTPASFINGVFISGAQPYEKFAAVIDEQLDKAQKLATSGTPRRRVYAELSKQQWKAPAPPSVVKEQEDRSIHLVPVGKSAVRGKPTALVTIVEFADFQCPFCGRVEATLRQVEQTYGDKVRLVYKHNPLPFHPRAAPAAELAIEVRAQKGDAAFWQVHDALYADQKNLDDASLEALAASVGLNGPRTMKAVSARKHQAEIDADVDLADDLNASGTPHFFINGRRLVGAQPFDKFKAVIDEEMAKAEALVRGGVAPTAVYARVLAGAVSGPGPEKKIVPAPTAASPSRGSANAKVVVQYFGDFQCPFCKRVNETLAALEAEFPGKIRLVFRHRPLPFHKDAPLAHQAAMEAFQQRGSAGFFAMYELIYAAQGQPGGIERPALETYARQLGLDMGRFVNALDTGVHQAAIDADVQIADTAQISGTPSFVINGYFVSGAQPLAKFRKIVRLALAGK
ncbi:thiol:disulfide oxidoreductase [Minicystis rosea]|nr:thiol:disulfide oxidoreductase [Minicystis rosea]